VFCQPELHGRVADGDVPLRQQFMPMVQTSSEEIKMYAKDPKNKPKLDFKPKGTIPQPSMFFLIKHRTKPFKAEIQIGTIG
jgi:hypothetical protein